MSYHCLKPLLSCCYQPAELPPPSSVASAMERESNRVRAQSHVIEPGFRIPLGTRDTRTRAHTKTRRKTMQVRPSISRDGFKHRSALTFGCRYSLMNSCCLMTAASSVGANIFGDFSVMTVPVALPVPMRVTTACTYHCLLAVPFGLGTGAGCATGAERPGAAEGAAKGAGVGGGALMTTPRSTTSRAAMRRTTSQARTQAATVT